MKPFFHLIILALALALTPPDTQRRRRGKAAPPKGQGQESTSILVPKELKLQLELNELPGGATEDSFWEVSYEWQITNRSDYDEAVEVGRKPPGLLLKKKSFHLDDLSKKDQRQVQITVPVKGKLLDRILGYKKKPQVLWLTATVRIHDPRLRSDPSRQLHTAWRLSAYPEGVTVVRVNVSFMGDIDWSMPGRDNQPPVPKENR